VTHISPVFLVVQEQGMYSGSTWTPLRVFGTRDGAKEFVATLEEVFGLCRTLVYEEGRAWRREQGGPSYRTTPPESPFWLVRKAAANALEAHGGETIWDFEDCHFDIHDL